MAIYHFSAQIISRSQGRSVVAAAAYRSGEKITDERTGLTYDYTKRKEIECQIMAPADSPSWVHDRTRLWNEVESLEKRKDSQLCREINVALPKELNNDQQRELIKGFVNEQFVNQGMVADVSIHRDNPENPHAHILLATRNISEEGFGTKNRDWNKVKLLEQWREKWAEHANRELEKINIQERIDHRSNKDRGLETLPQIHMGHNACALEERGISTERGQINRDIKEYNQNVIELKQYRDKRDQFQFLTAQERADVKNAAKSLKTWVDLPKINDRYTQLDRWEKSIERKEKGLYYKGVSFENANKLVNNIEHHQAQAKEDSLKRFIPIFGKEAGEDYKFHKEQAIRLDNKLNKYREKLGFKTIGEFKDMYAAFNKERDSQMSQFEKQRDKIRDERKILTKAEEALKSAEIKKAINQYPELESIKYIDYDGARAINNLNKDMGRTVSPDEIRAKQQEVGRQYDEITSRIKAIEKESERLSHAKHWVEKFESRVKSLDKMEKPHKKLFRIFSKESEADYKQAQKGLEEAKNMMNRYGVADYQDYEQQLQRQREPLVEKNQLNKKAEELKPNYEMWTKVQNAIERAERENEQKDLNKQWNRYLNGTDSDKEVTALDFQRHFELERDKER